MLKRMLQHLALVGCLALAAQLAAAPLPEASPESVGMSSERLALIDRMTQDYVSSGKVPGMLTLVARGGKIVHLSVAGQRGLNDDRPLQKDALFRIYSMTKPITAVAAMQLYEQGAFRLQDPVSKFVPELKGLQVMDEAGNLVPAKHEFTMHELLTHTAGLSYGFNPEDPVDKLYREAHLWAAKDLTDFAQKLAQLPLRYQPGTKWHYSVAVDVTGLVVERLSGMRFDRYLAEHLFKPLGMEDTFFEVPEAELPRFLPNQVYDQEEKRIITAEEGLERIGLLRSEDDAMVNYTEVSLYSGGGGLVSTAMDYMKFAEMLRAGGTLNGARILGPKTIAYMTRNHLSTTVAEAGPGEDPLAQDLAGVGFGLGFGVVTDSVALRVMGSEGEYNWGGAAGTVFWVDPVEDLVVVGMIQLMTSPWPFREDLQVRAYQALTESYAREGGPPQPRGFWGSL